MSLRACLGRLGLPCTGLKSKPEKQDADQYHDEAGNDDDIYIKTQDEGHLY